MPALYPIVKSVAASQITVSAGSIALPAFGVNPANGDTIVVCQAWFSSTAGLTSSAPTDTAGNTYTRVGAADLTWGANLYLAMWKAENIVGGSAFVITLHVSNSSTIAGVARCLTAALKSAYALDGTTNQVSGTSSATTAASGPSGGRPNAIYIACVTDGQTDPASFTPEPGWNDRGANQTNNGTSQDLGTQDFVSGDPGVRTGTWTGPNTTFGAYGAMIASFAGPPPVAYASGGVIRRRN